MPLQTNLNKPPYNDTFSPKNDYLRTLFQPSVSVQARELNELQSTLANQIERFGDNIFRPGTIVSGCNFGFLNPFPYIKLEDQSVTGGSVTPSAYVNSAIFNATTGLRAQVVDFADGFVSTDPNLKTLYIRYLNTGYNANTSAFSAGDALTIYDPVRNGLELVSVVGTGSGFANSDQVISVSAIAVTPVSGTLANGQYVVNGLGANVQIIGVDSTTLANSGQVILSIAPRVSDLADATVNASAWTLSNGATITNTSNTASARVSGIIGTGYQGLPVTDALGGVQQIVNLNKGFGYTSLPYVTLRSANNSGGYTGLVLTPQNYIAKVKVATTAGAVGNGYAFGVNEGIVYLRGSFLRVAPQTVIVSKYDQLPDNVSVSFTAIESIVDANIDPSLNDPAAGDSNGAPGADRLKVVPRLSVTDTVSARANSASLPLVSWNAGNPYIQNQQTTYSTVGDEMASRMSDQSGDFFIDPFLVTTSTLSSNATLDRGAVFFDYIIDPGKAYIQGYKVQTDSNFVLTAPYQATTSVGQWNVSLNYGNYLVVNEAAGLSQFNTGDVVNLYNAPRHFVSNSAAVRAGTLAANGTQIGTAQIRGFQHLAGTPGTNSATYALYLFNVNMNSGGSFSTVQGVGYYPNGTCKAVADVVRQTNPTTGVPTTVLASTGAGLVWPSGKPSILNVNAASYQFNSFDGSLSIANSGILTKSLATTGWSFPWVGTTLSTAQMDQIVVVPTATDLVSSTVSVGTWVSNTLTANLVCNTGGAALSALSAGDWVTLSGNSTQVDLKQVIQVVNNTFVVLDSAPGFANASAVYYRTFPKNLPIPLSTRSGISANVAANGTLLSINIGFAVNTATSQAVSVGVPIQISNATPQVKTVNRNAFVKIVCSNNAANTVGPWSLGVADAFRLRGVYVGNSTVDTTGTNYVSQFSIDNNQDIDFLGLSTLNLKSQVSSPLSSASYILVQFDYYSVTGTGGYYATPSYTQTSNVGQLMVNDTVPLQFLTTMAATWEVPEFFTDSGDEVDLLGCIDFRPYAQATATPGTNATSAPLNPSNTVSFNTTEKLFPVPGTAFSANCEYFLPRLDTVYVDKNGTIDYVQGKSLIGSGRSPAIPAGTMKIADVLIPEYPNLPAIRNMYLVEVLNTGIINGKYQTSRFNNHSIKLLSTNTQDAAKVYTNHDLAEMDRRLQNVEYYVNLSQLETGLKTMVIPSSSDPSVNRYQFGFFADDFATGSLSDIGNPTYRAALENGDIVPSKMTWEVYMGDDFSGAQSYISQKIMSQDNATIGDHADPTAKPQCAVSLANTIAFQLVYRNAFDLNGLPPQDGQVDLVSFTLADGTHMVGANAASNGAGIDSASTQNLGSGIVTLFFYAYDHPVQFQILQGNTVVADSSQAVNLSANDITNLTTGTVMNQWFNDQTGLYMKNFVAANATFVEYAGKIAWNYSGSGNTQISIKTLNGSGVRDWRWVLSYPINGDTAGCVPPPPSHTCPSGYIYNPTTGGCDLIPHVVDPGPVVNIVWETCMNHGVTGLVQKVLAVQASGARIGTITVVKPDWTHYDPSTGKWNAYGPFSGSLDDFLNPVSWQNQSIMGFAVANMGVGGGVADFASVYAQLSGQAFGTYVWAGDHIQYHALNGQVMNGAVDPFDDGGQAIAAYQQAAQFAAINTAAMNAYQPTS